MRQYLLSGCALAIALAVSAGVAQAAVVTFAPLGGGDHVDPIPSTYQPLLSGSPGDGAALGVSVSWGGAYYVTGGHPDTFPIYGGENGAIAFDLGAGFNITFSSPVALSDIEFNSRTAGPHSIDFKGFSVIGATTPVYDSGVFTYSQGVGSVGWQSLTGLGGLLITQLVISSSADIEIGAFTVDTSVPEPASFAILTAGLLGLVARGRALQLLSGLKKLGGSCRA